MSNELVTNFVFNLPLQSIGMAFIILGILLTIYSILYKKKSLVLKSKRPLLGLDSSKSIDIIVGDYHATTSCEVNLTVDKQDESKVLFILNTLSPPRNPNVNGGVFTSHEVSRIETLKEASFKLTPGYLYNISMKKTNEDVDIKGSVNYEIYRVEKTPDWLLQISLTLITIGCVFLLTFPK